MKLSLKVLSLLLGLGLWMPVASAAVLPADAVTNRRIFIMRNVSGATQPSHTAYVLQDNSSDANVLVGQSDGLESSLGLDVTTTTTADSKRFVGCQLDSTCLDDGLCRVVREGPAICLWAGSTDNTNTRMATVGTTTVAGRLGSGSSAGLTMSLTLDQTAADTIGTTAGELNGSGDTENRWIWVNPQNN